MMGENQAEDKTAAREEEELGFLRRQNAELKRLIQKGLKGRLTLEDLPPELRDDRDFVAAAAEVKGFDWSTLPQKSKDDVAVACATFEHQRKFMSIGTGRNRIRIVGSTAGMLHWSELPYHLKTNKEVLMRALRSDTGPAWKDIPIWLQDDVELLSVAVRYEKIWFQDVPPELQRNNREIAFYGVERGRINADECPCLDAAFFKQVIEEGKLEWPTLPTKLKNDVNFALSISHLSNKKLPDQMMSHVVELRQDKAFWRKLLEFLALDNDFKTPEFRHLLEKFLPAELGSDHDFMLEMIGQCSRAFEHVDNVLARDLEFCKMALNANAAVLECLSPGFQELHRDLVLKTIPRLRQFPDKYKVARCVARNMRPSFWEEFDFAMTWMTSGLGFPSLQTLGEDLLDEWSRNRHLSLANAIHGGSLHYDHDCQFITDIDFMREVLEHQPGLYCQAAGAARRDPVIMTIAFASLPELAVKVMMKLHFQGKDDEIQEYLCFLRSNLIPFETFSTCILGNMLSAHTLKERGTNLTLLNQGLETSSNYKKVLAEYLGIPTGKWLCRLQQAEKNVLEAVAPWTHNSK